MTGHANGPRGSFRRLVWALGLSLVSAAMAACGGASRAETVPGTDQQGVAMDLPVEGQSQIEGESSPDSSQPARALVLPTETLEDRQGAVQVAVTPLGRESAQAGRLIFEVAMNTHSVDLSMDLAQLATLETDTGLSLKALRWSGGNGHHVTGWLEFAFPQGEEARRLAEADLWRLIVRNVDAPTRVYEWSQSPSP